MADTPPYDPNYLIKLENAIKEKYGAETIENPKANWNIEKEKKFLKQIKDYYRNSVKSDNPSDKAEVEGVLLPAQLINKESTRTCTSCDIYSFDIQDDLYMFKFECCKSCYIEYVEGREERWFQRLQDKNLKK